MAHPVNREPEASMLSDSLKRYWWITLFRGIIAILFVIVVFTQTGIALVTLTLLFGAFVFADGAANIVSAFGGRDENENWGVLLLAGLAGVGVGILTLMSPGLTALALVFYI